MNKGFYRSESARFAGRGPETSDLPGPVEFEVRVTVTLDYTMRVKAKTNKEAWDQAESLSWPADFEEGGPFQIERIGTVFEPRAESLWRDGGLKWERQ